jgi:hypothetical protein
MPDENMSPDFVMIVDGKEIDEPLHAPMLSSKEGNRLSDLAVVESAIARGLSRELIELLYGPLDGLVLP